MHISIMQPHGNTVIRVADHAQLPTSQIEF